MMIKVNGEYLEFDGEIEIDRKAKLFQDIETVDGDFSYEFELRLTSHNMRVLGFPFPDNISKLVYRRIPSEVLNDNGESASGPGDLRIERIVRDIAYCSFFSGNSNWFSLLEGNVSDLDLSAYDRLQTLSEIQDSWTESEGLVYPMVDSGVLSLRMYQVYKIEDFTPAMYVKTLFKEIFQEVGIKIEGDINNDFIFNNAVIFSNSKDRAQIENRSSYVGKTTPQVIPLAFTKITFDDDSTDPFFDGSQDNFDITNSLYTADVRMNVQVEFSFKGSISGTRFYIYKNGFFYKVIGTNPPSGSAGNYSIKFGIDAGDYIEVYSLGTGTITSAEWKITPTYIYQAYGKASLLWSKQQFVSNFIKLFNYVPTYNPYSKTVRFDLFDKIKTRPYVDISEFVQVSEIDYTQFISEYGKKNIFKYQQGQDIENVRAYNITQFIKYGDGQLISNNEFLEDSKEVLSSDFSSPISYIHRSIGASIEKINFVDLVDNGQQDITSIEDDGFGLAELHMDNVSLFTEGDIVRIKDALLTEYNGDWYVIDVVDLPGLVYIKCLGMAYSGDTTAKATAMIYESTDEENVYMMINVPNYEVNEFSPLNDIYVETTPVNTAAISYFNMISIGEVINEEYKQGLSFGSIENPLSYQRSILDTYWQSFKRILQDPVMLMFIANIPAHIYEQLDFLSPVYIKTLESVNLYYLNRISGYKGSHIPCEGELIKLP